MSAPKIAHRGGAYKPEHRDDAELLERSMLSDLAGLLCVSSLIGVDVPRDHCFCSSGAGEGLVLGREALAKVFNVSVDSIHIYQGGRQ